MAVPKKKRSSSISKQKRSVYVSKKLKNNSNSFTSLIKLFFSLKKKQI